MEKINEVPVGFSIPLHQSLTQKVLWMGIPREMLICEALVAVIGGIIFKTLTVPLLVFLVHIVMNFATKRDPYFLETWMRSLQHKKYYDR